MKKVWIVALVLVLAGSMLVSAAGLKAGPKAGPNGEPKRTRIEGVITAIDADNQQIIVAGVTVQVTPNTVIRTKEETLSFDDLAVDMTVVVCGIMEDDVLRAHTITVKYGGK